MNKRQKHKIWRQRTNGRSYVLWLRAKGKATPFLMEWPGFFLSEKLIGIQEITAPTGTVFYLNIVKS